MSHFFDKSNKFKNLHIEKREIGVFKIVISNKTTKKELITGEQSESNPITKNERVILSYKEDIKGVITELETLEPNRNESLKNAFLNFDDPLATANINEGVYYLIYEDEGIQIDLSLNGKNGKGVLSKKSPLLIIK